MEQINKKDDQITFKAELDESLANAIRRYIAEISKKVNKSGRK